MSIETEFRPSPTPSRAFPALRCDPAVKTPPPSTGVPLWQKVMRTEERALEALECARAVRSSLGDLSRRAS